MQLKHCSWSELTSCTMNSIAVQISVDNSRKSWEFGRLGLNAWVPIVSQWGAVLVTNPAIINLWFHVAPVEPAGGALGE